MSQQTVAFFRGVPERFFTERAFEKISEQLSSPEPYRTMKHMVFFFILAVVTSCVNSYSFQPLRQQFLKKVTVFTVGCSFFLAPHAADAAASNVKTYVNTRYHTKIDYPADFEDALGNVDDDASGRKVVAFIDPKNKDVSASLVFTAIPADYTRLTSFGTKDMIRAFVVPKEQDGLTTQLLSESTKGEDPRPSYAPV